jgi:hypothetical protein
MMNEMKQTTNRVKLTHPRHICDALPPLFRKERGEGRLRTSG